MTNKVYSSILFYTKQCSTPMQIALNTSSYASCYWNEFPKMKHGVCLFNKKQTTEACWRCQRSRKPLWSKLLPNSFQLMSLKQINLILAIISTHNCSEIEVMYWHLSTYTLQPSVEISINTFHIDLQVACLLLKGKIERTTMPQL